MNDLIPTQQNDNGEILVSARDLFKFIGASERFSKWWERMVSYGFSNGIDYTPYQTVHPQNKQKITDYAMKLDMAKEISMLQRNDKGKQARQYFIEIEKKWNSPEMIVKRAMEIQDQKIRRLESENQELLPKATYHDLVLQSDSLLSTTQIAKDFGLGAPTLNKILHELGIQYKKGHRWYLYYEYQDKGYAQSKTWAVNAEETKDHMYWTQKGRLFIYETLKNKKGILPIVEREKEAI